MVSSVVNCRLISADETEQQTIVVTFSRVAGSENVTDNHNDISNCYDSKIG